MTRLVRTDAPPSRPMRRGYLVRGPIAPVFVERGALSPADAIPFTPSSPREAKAFAALRRSVAWRGAEDGAGARRLAVGGAVSLAAWLAAVSAGRMIAYW